MKIDSLKSLLTALGNQIVSIQYGPSKSVQFLTLSILTALLTSIPARAAEKVSFFYGTFSESIQISSLENFAKNGIVGPDLNFYFKLAKVNAETQRKFREALSKPIPINPVLLSRFTYSEMGELILNQLGLYFQIPKQGNGKYALRSALILAASDPEGLTLLNFLEKYPTNLYIDVAQSLQAFENLERMLKATDYFMAKMAQFSSQEFAGERVDFSSMPDLRKSGSFPVRQQRWVLNDTNRNRQLYVIVVQPESFSSEKVPVVILSHGLGSKPEDFVERAQHLASYGFVVALPQHPGSDAEQVQKLKQGLSGSYFLTSEFTDRPRDVSYVIDELERRNQSEFGGRLDLQSVGVVGHSFGGYTALAVAGATIDFKHLQQECDRPFGYQNVSLLLQCQALTLPRQAYNFRDTRVKAVFAANPVNYGVFGAKGLSQIQVPVLIAGGSDDPAAPTAFEQARSFPLLSSPIKYLAIAEGQAHVNLANLDVGVTRMLNSIPGLSLASPELIGNYVNAITLAFFQTHLLGNSAYQPYMQSSYANYLSQDQKFKLFLISETSNDALKGAIAEFRARHW